MNEEFKVKKNKEKQKEEYAEFEKLCKEQKITFEDDVFQNVHLDSGNLYAFYSAVREQGIQQGKLAEKKEELDFLKLLLLHLSNSGIERVGQVIEHKCKSLKQEINNET